MFIYSTLTARNVFSHWPSSPFVPTPITDYSNPNPNPYPNPNPDLNPNPNPNPNRAVGEGGPHRLLDGAIGFGVRVAGGLAKRGGGTHIYI